MKAMSAEWPREVVADVEEATPQIRELSALRHWASAQHAQHAQHVAESAPLAFEKLCALTHDSNSSVRHRACVLLASMPRVPASKLEAASNKRHGVPAKMRKAGGVANECDVMELGLIEDAVSPEAAAVLAAATSGALLDEMVAGALQMALEDQASEVREAAVCALADLTWPEGAGAAAILPPDSAQRVLGLLVDSCADEAASVRLCTLLKLGALGERVTLRATHLLTVAMCAAEDATGEHDDGWCAPAAVRLIGSCRVADREALVEAVGALVGAARAHPARLAAQVHAAATALSSRHPELVLGKAKAQLRTLTEATRDGGATLKVVSAGQVAAASHDVTPSESVVASVLHSAIMAKRAAATSEAWKRDTKYDTSEGQTDSSTRLLASRRASLGVAGASLGAAGALGVTASWGAQPRCHSPAAAHSSTVKATVKALQAVAQALGASLGSNGNGSADTAESSVSLLRTAIGALPPLAFPGIARTDAYLHLRLAVASRICQLTQLVDACHVAEPDAGACNGARGRHSGSAAGDGAGGYSGGCSSGGCSSGSSGGGSGSKADLHACACGLLGDSYHAQFGFNAPPLLALPWLHAVRLVAHVVVALLVGVWEDEVQQSPESWGLSGHRAGHMHAKQPPGLHWRAQLLANSCEQCEQLGSEPSLAAAQWARTLLRSLSSLLESRDHTPTDHGEHQTFADEQASRPDPPAPCAWAAAAEWVRSAAVCLVRASDDGWTLGVPAPWRAQLRRAAPAAPARPAPAHATLTRGSCAPTPPSTEGGARAGWAASAALPAQPAQSAQPAHDIKVAIEGRIEAFELPWRACLLEATYYEPGPRRLSGSQLFELDCARHRPCGLDEYTLARSPLRLRPPVSAAHARVRLVRRFELDLAEVDRPLLRLDERFSPLPDPRELGLALHVPGDTASVVDVVLWGARG